MIQPILWSYRLWYCLLLQNSKSCFCWKVGTIEITENSIMIIFMFPHLFYRSCHYFTIITSDWMVWLYRLYKGRSCSKCLFTYSTNLRMFLFHGFMWIASLSVVAKSCWQIIQLSVEKYGWCSNRLLFCVKAWLQWSHWCLCICLICTIVMFSSETLES